MPAEIKTAKCVRCGITTTVPEALVRQRNSQTRAFCPPCADWLGFRNYLLFQGTLTAWAVLFCMAADDRASAAKMALLLLGVWIFGQMLMIILHEAAHAGTALFVGMRVFKINLGNGKPLLAYQAGRTEILISRTPSGGGCVMVPQSAKGAGWRFFIAIAAAPAVHIATIAVVAIWGSFNHVAWRNPSTVVEFVALEFMAINIFFLWSNLRPRTFNRGARKLASDGLQLFRLLRDAPALVNDFLLSGCALEFEACRKRYDLEGKRKWMEESRSLGATPLLLDHFQVSILMQQEAWAELLEFCVLAEQRAATMAWSFYPARAWGHLMFNAPGGIEHAAQLSAAYLSALPWDPHGHLLQAEVNILQGLVDQAAESLRKASKRELPVGARTEAACIEAQIELRRGNTSRAKSLVEWARKRDVRCMLAGRVERELDASTMAQPNI